MKAMRKLLVVLPVLLALAGGCDSTRRDFTYCNQDYQECGSKVCNLASGRCENADASAADTFMSDDVPADLPASEAALPQDAGDAPVVVDVPPADTTPLDTGAVDLPQIVDVFVPDTRVPDAAGTCAVDNDCFGVASGSYCVNNQCFACKTSSQCNNDAGVPFCSAQNTCVSCAGVSSPDGGNACPASAPVCAATGSCVECVSNSDCPQGGTKAFCVQNKCQGCNAPGATASVPASGGTDGGSTDSGPPDGGGLANVGPCPGTKPVCATTGTIAGQCVGCVTSGDCSGSTPVCNTANVCVPCTSDTQCTTGPGVCMFHQDGRCASDAETIYVQNSTATCSAGGGAGTAASPYCDSQAGINAVTVSKRVIVMSGSNLYPVTSTTTFSSGQITLISPSIATAAATTTAGAFVGIHVTAGDIYVRGLVVANGTNTGLTVDAGATLRMDRCIVKGNAGGGLIVKSGASFDIANSVFDDNGPGLVGTTTTFGGIYLGGAAPSAGPHRFWFNTVVNNQDRGIICFDTTQTLTGMLLFGNTNGDFLSCAMDATSKWSSGSPTPSGASSDITNPALTSTDHLTSGSKCRDFINASVAHPFDDIDGELRPKPANGKLDCGADEY
jgi:hypothetical protein